MVLTLLQGRAVQRQHVLAEIVCKAVREAPVVTKGQRVLVVVFATHAETYATVETLYATFVPSGIEFLGILLCEVVDFSRIEGIVVEVLAQVTTYTYS